MPSVSSVSPSGISYIDWLESGLKWASGNFTYSFPTSASFYTGFGRGAYGSGEQTNGFQAFNATQQAATASILNMYSQVANVTFTQITESTTQSATLRYAESNLPGTAWGYYPSVSPEGGDAWFNSSSGWYNNPVLGNYAYLTIVHETGHLLGLKHPHGASGSFGAAPVSADSLEYTVMSYRSYIGASTTQGLTNGTWSFPQTLMMYDIAALQYLYGANYTTNNTNTIYKWNPATGQETINGVAQAAPGGNTIFSTVWDGGGTDTYDFSNYTTNVTVSLQPGTWTTVSSTQLANLGGGHYAAGNIANAYLFNNNTASLIENALGGTGADVITGNIANNTLTGGAGGDTLDGVSGTDTAVYTGASSAYQVTQNADGSWKVVDLRAGSPDGIDTLRNIDFLQFSDATVTVGATPPPPPPPVVPAPVISTVTPDTASPTDGITSATILTLAGTALVNGTVRIYDGATLLGSTVASAGGNWSFVTATLNDGAHNFTATATDASGNSSAASGAKNVTVDTATPVSPTIGLQSVDSGIAGDNITNIKVVSLTGVAEISSTIKIYDGATQLGSAVANAEGVWNLVLDVSDDQAAALAGAGLVDNLGVGGHATGANETQAWAFTTGALADGTHNFTVTSTDAAGNVSAATALNVTIDTVAPNTPAITGNTIVNTNQVQLTGTAGAGSIVKLFDGTAVLATLTADAGGAWSFTTGALPGGAHTFTATASDVAGNTSAASPVVTSLIGGIAVESNGVTSLTKVGTNFYLCDSGGAGPSLKFSGAVVVAGQFDAWTPIGAEKTASGYQIAWKVTGADQYGLWVTDNNGNYVSSTTMTGSSSALKTAEPLFYQDLNGDGTIGNTPPPPPPPPPPSGTAIESNGVTSLTKVGTNFYLCDSGGAGPSLKFSGAVVVAGQFDAWTPIGAEKTASGYQIAWKVTGADQYGLWVTDNNGNYVSSTTMTGSSSALKTAEPLFYQDLNGDGTIGNTPPPPPPPPPPSGTAIESNGVTSLTKVGTNFYLCDSGGAGPSLKFSGAVVVAGQFDAWTPIGAEKTASGYQIAWKVTGADQYGLWVTDNNGNYVSSTTMTGSSSALKTAEPLFYQDLNGDGTIGNTPPPPPPPPPPSGTAIESNGVTSLTAVGNKYYLYNSSSTGPTLKFGGADVVVGQFSGWTPLGAEKTANGYEMAWKTGAGQYTVWNTDNNGNKVSDIGMVSGSDPALQSLEASFGQDLNGDGIIGEATSRGRGTVVSGAAANEALFGSDTFVFAGNFVKNTVADVHAGNDVLQFGRTALTDFADVLAHAVQAGTDGTVAVDATHTVLPQHDPFHLV